MSAPRTRYAIGLAIFVDGKDEFVVGRRTSLPGREYPGYWSLPSQRITATEYRLTRDHHPPSDMIARLCAQKLEGLSVSNVRLLKIGERGRAEYDLVLLLLGCDLNGPGARATRFYDPIEKMSVPAVLESNQFRCGTCVSLLVQHLIESQRMDPGIDFLELSPELADSNVPLDERTPEELWRLAARDYDLLLSGRSGGDGMELRKATLDLALDLRLSRLVGTDSRFLDVGCGNGSLVRKMRERTNHAYGIDIGIAEPPELRDIGYLYTDTIYSMKSHFPERSFDVVLLNLVVQWIADLDAAITELEHVLSSHGTLLVTLPTPYGTHCGRWRLSADGYVWEMTRRIPERRLVMLNRMVGPLWYFGRSTLTVLDAFITRGYSLRGGEEVFLDSHAASSDVENVLRKHPAFARLFVLPPFTILEFELDR